MGPSTELPGEARCILELARRDRGSAREALAALGVEEQVALVCETPVAQRAELLELSPNPEAVIPALPEAELCFTVKSLGLADAGWLLEHASDSQLVSCIDLDAWNGLELERSALDGWVHALVEAGDETLARAAHALDPEILVLYLKAHLEVVLKPSEDGWEPPVGAQTIDGQFYFRARGDGDDLDALGNFFRMLFETDYWLYFRLMQGAIWEIDTEMEEWALRWRAGRLEDMGFPQWEEAMGIYGFLRREQRTLLPTEERALDVDAWRLPVWLPQLPVDPDAGHLVFRAAARLAAEERRAFFYALVGLANKVAVADRLSLADAESIPHSVEKAAQHTSRGLEHVAAAHGLDATEVLRRAPLERLFRVGVSLDREAKARVGSRA